MMNVLKISQAATRVSVNTDADCPRALDSAYNGLVIQFTYHVLFTALSG